MDRALERLAIAHRAVRTLAELTELENPTDIERDAAIQRFEYSFEASWKAVRAYLITYEGLVAGSPKRTIRSSRDAGLLDDTQTMLALEMADQRNLTVHTYDEMLARAIFAKLPGYVDLMCAWLEAIDRTLPKLDLDE